MADNNVNNYELESIGRSKAIARQNVNQDMMNISLSTLKNKNKQSFIKSDT